MHTRIRLLSLLLTLLALPSVRGMDDLDGSPLKVGNEEAARLYRESNDFVSSMAEGSYSYSYLQFYWKRAQSNIDRVRTVYPNSPTALALKRGELKVGPYELGYFKDRVLYNLELKRLAAFDDVNCAIFLYGREESEERRGAGTRPWRGSSRCCPVANAGPRRCGFRSWPRTVRYCSAPFSGSPPSMTRPT